MKALFIGGTGVISTAVGALALARGWELTLLNRGTNAARAPRGARVLTADIHDEAAVKAALGDERFDVAVDFIAFTEEDVQRDVRLFAGRAAQYIFISSASAYQKPVAALPITESTPLANPGACSRSVAFRPRRNRAAVISALLPGTIVNRPGFLYNKRQDSYHT